jgi:acetyltransferase-like isoleucine patch superfamily enzyme
MKEPRIAANPPAGFPPSGRRARARARWVALRRRGRVTVEPGVALGPGIVWDLGPGARVRLGAGCAIAERTRLHVADGEVQIGAGAVLGERCVIQVRTAATIGTGARLADEVAVRDHRPVIDDVDRPIREQGIVTAPVSIGARARIGARAVIGAGAVIADDAQISAQAVVGTELQREVRSQGPELAR